METIAQTANASPPLLIVSVLMILGKVLKSSPINNRYIPLILVVFGGVAWPLLQNPTHLSWEAGLNPVVLAVFQGIIYGFGAVGVHSSFREAVDGKKNGDTQFLKKDETKV